MNVRDLIIRHEGLMLKPYQCTAGKTSIGVGRNLDDVGITEEEAMMMLERDIAVATTECRKYPWFDGLDVVRRAAVIDLMFNLGAKRFASFVKFRQAMSQGNWEWAADELRSSRWHGQVGDRAKRIERMVICGEWPAELMRK